MIQVRFCGWLVGCVTLVSWCGSTSAQTIYKWTDDRGVVHFSDSPPADTKGIEERQLPAVPLTKSEPAEPGEKPETGEAEAMTTPGAAPSDPARVILVSRKTPRTGPSAMHIIGEVKNVGGADARGVSVAISAVDSTQGTPCLQEEAAVMPSTLHAGETGNFDVDLDSPCLYGTPNLDIKPVWD